MLSMCSAAVSKAFRRRSPLGVHRGREEGPQVGVADEEQRVEVRGDLVGHGGDLGHRPADEHRVRRRLLSVRGWHPGYDGRGSGQGRPGGIEDGYRGRRGCLGGWGAAAMSRSPSGSVAGFLRGVNQPSTPPDVPLLADVVVGASMLCLASNISLGRSAHFRDRKVPASPADGLLSPMRCRVRHGVGQPASECASAVYPGTRVLDSPPGQAALPCSRPVPERPVTSSRAETGLDHTGHRAAHKSPLHRPWTGPWGEPCVSSITRASQTNS
ncbi:hypothetical protein SGLAM104S_08745 [Streptomyces glaucescens]